MLDFRYAQFCPLTRAVEILGERWTLLVLRELFLGPKRFSDLKAGLNGVSPSVLADRLSKLEDRGIVTRRELPPPAASAVYELGEAGRALQPLLVELTRWGLRFMGTPSPEDTVRPEWLLLGLQVFARTTPTDDISAMLHVNDGSEFIDIYVSGGADGTVVSRTPMRREVRVNAPPLQMLMFVNGLLPADGGDAALGFEGDPDVVRRIPSLFDFTPTPAMPGLSLTDQPLAGRRSRPSKKATAPSGDQGAAGS